MPNVLIDQEIIKEIEKYLEKIDPDLANVGTNFFLASAIKESTERLGLEIKKMTIYDNGAYINYLVK
ncbi:hypothetical protein KAI65_01515 [Candidatus Parcubacteria bacterium]|nr:hypothetical protein [Candidatus Parcubacteria bacterium]